LSRKPSTIGARALVVILAGIVTGLVAAYPAVLGFPAGPRLALAAGPKPKPTPTPTPPPPPPPRFFFFFFLGGKRGKGMRGVVKDVKGKEWKRKEGK